MKFVIESIGEACGRSLATQRIVAVLRNLPDGKLITSRRLADLLGITLASFRIYSAAEPLQPYRTLLGKGVSVIWGNKKTIRSYARFRAKKEMRT